MIAQKLQNEWNNNNINKDEEFARRIQNEMYNEFGNDDDMFSGDNNLYNDIMGNNNKSKKFRK
jgi:hypothetical protein